jgi:hypothetical protein
MPLAVMVVMIVVSAIVAMGLVGYLIDKSAGGEKD